MRTRFVTEQNEIASSFGEKITPAYQTVDLRFGFKPIKNLSLGLAVLNAFDETYYNHLNFSYRNSNMLSGQIYEPGRNITAFVKYKF